MSEVLRTSGNNIFTYSETTKIESTPGELIASLAGEHVLILDVDGTLADLGSTPFVEKTVNLLTGQDFRVSPEMQRNYAQIDGMHPSMTTEIMMGFFTDPLVFRDAARFEDIYPVVMKALEQGWIPIVVSDRDWNLKEDAQHVTREWLDRNGYYEIPHIWICNTEERTDFAAALGDVADTVFLVEDKPASAHRLGEIAHHKHNVRALLLDRPQSLGPGNSTYSTSELLHELVVHGPKILEQSP